MGPETLIPGKQGALVQIKNMLQPGKSRRGGHRAGAVVWGEGVAWEEKRDGPQRDGWEGLRFLIPAVASWEYFALFLLNMF